MTERNSGRAGKPERDRKLEKEICSCMTVGRVVKCGERWVEVIAV